MKKFLGVLVSLIITAILLVTGCGGTDDKVSKYTVTFNYNYDGAPAAYTVEVDENKTVSAPENPTRDNYNFNYWCTTAECSEEADLTKAVTADVTYYAKWTASETYFTVTFDYNYIGAPAAITQTVKSGEAAEEIEQPHRDNITFTGWYTDEDCTESYDFSLCIERDTTIYAGWYEAQEGMALMTFYKNDGTESIFTAVEFSSEGNGSRVTKPATDPVRDGYFFDGWFADADCTEKFNFDMRYTENKSVYAAWRKIYTFEAEYTDLTNKPGNGYSGSSSDLGLIQADDTENYTASNGYFVGWLYYNGAFLEFVFDSEEDANDVTIVFRLSAEYDPFEPEKNQVKVIVNEDTEYEESYSVDVKITGYDLMEHNVYGTKDFANYTIASNVNIQKGRNTIILLIDNNVKGTGGTMNATAPLVDCMYLYTNANLTIIENQDNIKNKK